MTGSPRWNEDAEDGELVAACRAGSLEAFEVLVRRHQRPMLNLAWRMLGRYEEACEVVQDAFVAAYKGLPGFRGEARFSTWLTRITLNEAHDRLGRLAARRRHEAFSLDTAADGPPPEPASPAPSALDALEQQALRRRLQDCIEALPPDFRAVLVLRDLQERAYEEIGAVLAVREGTVKSRLFRAREGLRDCLERGGGPP